MGYDDEAHTVCDLFWGYWDALSWRVGSALGPIVGWSVIGLLCAGCLGFLSLLGLGFWEQLQYWMQVYHGHLLLAGIISLGVLLGILIGGIVAIVLCLFAIAFTFIAIGHAWRFVTDKTGTAWFKVPAKRGSSFLRVVGQWLYDLAHGVCTMVEIV